MVSWELVRPYRYPEPLIQQTQNPKLYNWSFGDNTTSTGQNPAHTYSIPGNYDVNLTVTTANGTSIMVKTAYIMANEIPTSWNWSFGDGQVSTDQNPEHTYLTAGVYDVNLTVITANGSSVMVKTAYITATNPPTVPVAMYTPWPYITGIGPYTEVLTDASTGSPTSCLMYWGDGSSSNDCSAVLVHQYKKRGVYVQNLSVTNSVGTAFNTSTAFIY